MKTAQIITEGPSALELDISYLNSVAFMYSPQLIRITGGVDPLQVTVKVTHMDSGRSYSETRVFHNGAVRFDISRHMQLLAPDIDTLFQRLDTETGPSLGEYFAFRITYRDTDGWDYDILEREDILAMYGTLDQGETYGGSTQRRLWLNFPQTFNLWESNGGEAAFVFDDAYIHPDTTGNGYCHECDLVATLLELKDSSGFAKILSRPMSTIGLTLRKRIEQGKETAAEQRALTLVPDESKDGTYLRWLNRRGEVSYWLFRNSQLRVTSAVDNSFTRFYEDDPAVPVAHAYNNSQKSDYREARELVLGACGLSREEFEDLCDLATSPLVERLLPTVAVEEDAGVGIYDGGRSQTVHDLLVEGEANAETEIEGSSPGSNRVEPSQYLWQRVNVAPGSYSRSIRRDTPNRQDLEFVIELPERNRVKI